jgi:hypothetical protein
VDINGDIIVRHREKGGVHAGYNNVKENGKTTFTGHDHRVEVQHYQNYAGLTYGVRSGMLADSPADPQFVNYLEARHPNWHSTFIVCTFVDGVLLQPEIVRKWDSDHVQFRGEIIPV